MSDDPEREARDEEAAERDELELEALDRDLEHRPRLPVYQVRQWAAASQARSSSRRRPPNLAVDLVRGAVGLGILVLLARLTELWLTYQP